MPPADEKPSPDAKPLSGTESSSAIIQSFAGSVSVPRLRMTPSEYKLRLYLSLVAAAGANLAGLLGDNPPTGWQWVKIAISTIVVVALNWRAFITNPQATTNDPVPANPPDLVSAGSTEETKTPEAKPEARMGGSQHDT